MSTVTVAPGREHSAGVRVAMQRHPLGAFFVIAFAVTWAYEIVVFGLLGAETILWSIPATFGPAIAAVLVTHAVDGRPGLRSFLRRLVLWRVDVRWYLFALVVMPAVAVAGYVFMPDAKQNVDGGALAIAGTYVSMLVILMLLGGGQEEPGWRGFALPRMQERWHPLKASVLLGVIWGVWHLPLFAFLKGYDRSPVIRTRPRREPCLATASRRALRSRGVRRSRAVREWPRPRSARERPWPGTTP